MLIFGQKIWPQDGVLILASSHLTTIVIYQPFQNGLWYGIDGTRNAKRTNLEYYYYYFFTLIWSIYIVKNVTNLKILKHRHSKLENKQTCINYTKWLHKTGYQEKYYIKYFKISNYEDVTLRILTGNKHCQIKLHRLRKVQIWAFG